MDIEAEKSFVNAFVKPDLRERWLFMLASKRRRKQLQRLYHHFEFTAAYIEKLQIREFSPEGLEAALKAAGIIEPAYVISASPDIDARWLTFKALEGFLPGGTVIYSNALKAAIFRDEYEYYFLSNARRAN